MQKTTKKEEDAEDDAEDAVDDAEEDAAQDEEVGSDPDPEGSKDANEDNWAGQGDDVAKGQHRV